MNGVVLVTCAIVILAVAYRFYGKWLAKTWGIDPNALTPAHRLEDGQDYTPSSKFTVFANQFSSITGAGPVTGPIIAAAYGWLPAFLWLMIGGVFFGAVPDRRCLHHDHVRFCPGPDDPRCRRPYRPYVLPGTVQRR